MNKISNWLIVITMLPVILMGITFATIYWLCKFPFWYLNRQIEVLKKK